MGHAMARFFLTLALCCLAPVANAVAQPADFDARVFPELTAVNVGDDADLRLEVDASAQQFNGYDTRIAWDPTIVELVEFEEGPLMTGACGQDPFFEITSSTDSSIAYTHVILCAGVSLDGPGTLTTLRFHALAEGETAVRMTSDRDFTFLDAGIWINPAHPTLPRQVILHLATIHVGPVTSVRAEATPEPRLELLPVAPNPFNPSTDIRFRLAADSRVVLAIANAAGRRVWSRDLGHLTPGWHTLRWSGVDTGGAPLPSGVYWLRLRAAGELRERALTLVK